MVSSRVRQLFKPIARRVFFDEYVIDVSGALGGAVPNALVEEAVKLMASLIMSPGRLRALAHIAHPAVLAAVYGRYMQVDAWLMQHPTDIPIGDHPTDGALFKFLLIDLHRSLPPF